MTEVADMFKYSKPEMKQIRMEMGAIMFPEELL
jgi:hypothetical protein